jgi:hypothetical protein
MKLAEGLWLRHARRHCNILSLLFPALAMLAAPFAGAQSTGGRIRGTVSDPSGASVAAATVTLINEATHATRDMQSGASGEYIFIEVPVGSYEIEVTQAGFKNYVRKGVGLDLNEVISVDITLQLGSSAERVEVTGAPPVIDTTSTQLGAVVNERSSTQLPLNERDVYQLLQLQPGVQSQIGNDLFYGSDKAGVVTVNGGRGRSNNYSVNGGDGNDQFANLPMVQPSPDSIEEFRVITNSFDAEYGRNSGAVVNVVTKSGTNDLHGSAYEFFRNDVLNAHGFSFNPTPKPPFKQNQFGGTLGGPIKKDKTFFFGSYEGRRVIRGLVSQSVPVPTAANLGTTTTPGDFSFGAPAGETDFPGSLTTTTVANILEQRCGSQIGGLAGAAGTNGAAELAALAGNGGAAAVPYADIFPSHQIPKQCFDPAALSLLRLLPGAGGNASQVQSVTKSRDRGDQAQVHLDHELNKNQKLSVYYYYDNDSSLDPFSRFQQAGAVLGTFPGEIDTIAQQLNASHSWTISSSSVNEFRFTWFRESQPKFYTPTVTNAVTASCGSGAAAAFCFTGTSDTNLFAADPVTGNPVPLTNAPNCPPFGCGIHPGLGSKFEGVPDVTLGGTVGLFGNNFEGQLPQTGNTFQFNDNYSKIVGNHSFKFGGDFRYMRFDQTVYFNVNGEYILGSGGINDTGSSSPYANYLLGLPLSYSQGSANKELVRSKAVYLFAQDSWKIRSNLTLNYGLRWEMNTPLTDTGQKVQAFRPGINSKIYPCQLSSLSNLSGPGNTCDNQGVTPTGLLFPGDQGIPGGLFNTYYKAFAPRLGLNWSPGAKEGPLAKLTGGPGKMTISMGWGLFYNPIEQLVLEQFVAEPPFGISNSVSDPLFSTPFVTQAGATKPNVSDAFLSPPRNQPVDWSLYRPILLFGNFPTNMRTQYSAQYNLTIKRELPGDMLFQIGYVGTQGHRLLAIHDVNPGIAQTCTDLLAVSTFYAPTLADGSPNPNANGNLAAAYNCAPGFEDSQFILPANSIPAGMTVHLPYGSVKTAGPGNPAIDLVGLRPFSSPNCQPTTGAGCPADGTPIFTNILTEDTVAKSNYNSLQALFEKRFSRGLQFQASYTFSKSLDNASSFEEVLNPFNFNSTYGPSLYDSRHRFVFNYVWELPIPKMEGFAGTLLNGWQTSGIFTYQTGFPIFIQSCADNELQGNIQGFECPGRPNLVAPFQTHNPRTDGLQFDPAAFSDNVTLGTIGSSPRTVCCNSPISNWDFGLFKGFHLTEKLHMEFRTEVYNIFNHTQFFSVDGNISNATFGQPQKVRDPRLLQFALKLLF